MRVKTTHLPLSFIWAEGDEWLSPFGYTPTWHRVFKEGKWVDVEKEEDSSTGKTIPSTPEDTTNERSDTTTLPERDGAGTAEGDGKSVSDLQEGGVGESGSKGNAGKGKVPAKQKRG